MKKKLLVLLAVLAIMLLMVPTAFAADTSGCCGAYVDSNDGIRTQEPVYWNYDEESKTLTINGEGAMRDDAGGAGFYGKFDSFNEEVETLIIEEGVTHIGQGAFYMPNLKNVQIPNSVVSIGPYAFGHGEAESQWLKELKASPDEKGNVILNNILLYSASSGNIEIPMGVRSIAGNAITNATHVTLPKTVEYISYSAIDYWDNPDLVSVTVLNPECVFFKCNGWQTNKPSAIGIGLAWSASGPDSIYTISGLTISGYANSTAQAYCNEANRFTSENNGEPWTFVTLEDPIINPFTDVASGSFYYDSVLWAVENNITTGRTETTFAPKDPCKRSEVVTFLHRSQGEPAPSATETDFTDVKPSKFYTDAVAWAVEEEITNGMTATEFGTDLSCTRAQVVTFLWRAAGSPEPTSTECQFTDVKSGSFYYDAVLWAVENGITNGLTETTFGVKETCTRAQIVTFLHRFAG